MNVNKEQLVIKILELLSKLAEKDMKASEESSPDKFFCSGKQTGYENMLYILNHANLVVYLQDLKALIRLREQSPSSQTGDDNPLPTRGEREK